MLDWMVFAPLAASAPPPIASASPPLPPVALPLVAVVPPPVALASLPEPSVLLQQQDCLYCWLCPGSEKDLALPFPIWVFPESALPPLPPVASALPPVAVGLPCSTLESLLCCELEPFFEWNLW